MGILQAHKFKIISGLGVISAAGICVSTPFLTSETQSPKNDSKDPVNPKIPLSDQPPVALPTNKEPEKALPISSLKPEGKSEEGISAKLMTLKGKKTTLSDQVSQNITIYKGVLQKVQFLSQLDNELNKCKSKDEVNHGITEQEKNSLSTSYTEVKGDVQKYEDLKKEIEGDLKQKESYADSNNEDANRYTEFEKKFNEVNDKYKKIEDKKTGEKLVKNYKIIYDKLDSTNSTCSFKDVIKMNDLLGQRNDAST